MKKENNIVKKGCHSQAPLLGIFLIPNRCSDLIKERPLCYNNEEAGDPRQKPSGMTPLFKTRGFTLIELLVVVLIIGILAAVAVPQYQKAVTKSRYIKLKPLVKSIVNAEEVYYLANGDYNPDLDKLDVELPTPTRTIGGGTDGTKIYYFDWGYCWASSRVFCWDNKANMGYSLFMAHLSEEFKELENIQTCHANNNDSIQGKICQEESNLQEPSAGNGYRWK